MSSHLLAGFPQAAGGRLGSALCLDVTKPGSSGPSSSHRSCLLWDMCEFAAPPSNTGHSCTENRLPVSLTEDRHTSHSSPCLKSLEGRGVWIEWIYEVSYVFVLHRVVCVSFLNQVGGVRLGHLTEVPVSFFENRSCVQAVRLTRA